MNATLAADEIRRLPPALTVVQAAALLGIGRSNAYHGVKTSTWPTPVVRVGRCIRIPTVGGAAARDRAARLLSISSGLAVVVVDGVRLVAQVHAVSGLAGCGQEVQVEGVAVAPGYEHVRQPARADVAAIPRVVVGDDG